MKFKLALFIASLVLSASAVAAEKAAVEKMKVATASSEKNVKDKQQALDKARPGMDKIKKADDLDTAIKADMDKEEAEKKKSEKVKAYKKARKVQIDEKPDAPISYGGSENSGAQK